MKISADDIHIIFDTETTGFDPYTGDRVVEIGAIKLQNRKIIGEFHAYINPERDMPDGAYQVHGISSEFLKDKPKFAEIANDFLNFIENHTLVAHNSTFDMKFINYEIKLLGKTSLSNKVIDTLQMAKSKLPGKKASLDRLCDHFKIDTSERVKHGALLDAMLLSKVFIKLVYGEHNLIMAEEKVQRSYNIFDHRNISNPIKEVRKDNFTPEEIQRHNNIVKGNFKILLEE